jgi:hypothetical protein
MHTPIKLPHINEELFALLRLEATVQCLIFSLDKHANEPEIRRFAFLEMRKAIKDLNSLRGYDFDAKSSIEDLLKVYTETL